VTAPRVFPFSTKDGRSGIVRVARSEDARASNHIVERTLAERPRTLTVTPRELWTVRMWRRFRMDWTPGGVWLVAEVDGNVVGQLDVRRSPRVAESHRVEFGITVGPEHRGLGVGRALMEAMEVWAREHGITKLMLHVFAHNERAQKLYESMGYRVEGRLRRHVRFPDGEEIDNLVMAKFLE
jgi:RimJ/RimL family protein N-acetyltransferase